MLLKETTERGNMVTFYCQLPEGGHIIFVRQFFCSGDEKKELKKLFQRNEIRAIPQTLTQRHTYSSTNLSFNQEEFDIE